MGVPPAVLLEIPADEGAPLARMPPRIRRRLLRGAGEGGGKASTAEGIEAKLREADLRRQKFHEGLSSKARYMVRIAQSQEEVPLGPLLEVKPVAADQKRLSLTAKEQSRLAKLDRLRYAGKNDAEMGFKREREELGMRIVSRIQKAEEKRKQLQHSRSQRRAALEERTKRFFLHKEMRENKYREHVRSASPQKCTAAEKRQMGLMESEKRQAQCKLLQVQLAATIASSQKETERSMSKEQFEDKLQRAKWQMAEHSKQQGSPPSSIDSCSIKNGEFLSRKLARCWRRFITSMKTTVVLAKAFNALGINQHSVVSMPFEELCRHIKSPAVCHTTKALLDRLESRFLLYLSSSSSKLERTKLVTNKASGNSDTSKLPKYSVKMVLCAYMILGHPEILAIEKGEREEQLVKSAASFVKEFELLVKVVLDGPDGACILSHSMLHVSSPGSSNYQESLPVVIDKKKFRSQLVAFDKAWCTYCYNFVMWKKESAKSTEGDLIKAACEFELSMMQTCKITTEAQANNVDVDLNAIQKQLVEGLKQVRETIREVGGEAGIERMESALSETRSKFLGAKEFKRSIVNMATNTASPTVTSSPGDFNLSENRENSNMDAEKTKHVIKYLSRVPSSPSERGIGVKALSTTLSSAMTEKMPITKEQMVNEILHDTHSSLADNSDNVGSIEGDFEAKIKETMEKAYWDVVAESLREAADYSHLINLVKEVRETLHELAPTEWKDEISDNIKPEVLSQVLDSGSQDSQYLGQILQYSLGILRKLSSPEKEDDMKKNHDKLLRELIEDPESKYRDPNSFAISVMKGLRFTMEELKALKAEVSRAHFRLLELLIKGSGVEYLQKAFADHYGSPSDALASIPSTAQWFSSTKNSVGEEWNEHVSSVSVLTATNHIQPLVATLRTGRGVPCQTQSLRSAADIVGLPECTGERLGMVSRIGLLHFISSMEPITEHSVPETFKLNWLRLRSIQSNFQQMIVIAISMLVLHQVLLSENPKIVPSELENTTMELFNTLTKLLGFSDFGTKHIIEVMMRSSTATCTSSDEMIANRKQILTRIFLKSLRTDDTVFQKVSRSVYCAFRAVILGGSGAKGRKLADAALRRIGAIKLSDWVVKEAEILIKAAMISEQVHGPWYKQLL